MLTLWYAQHLACHSNNRVSSISVTCTCSGKVCYAPASSNLGDIFASYGGQKYSYMSVTLVTISAKYTPFPNMYPVCREKQEQSKPHSITAVRRGQCVQGICVSSTTYPLHHPLHTHSHQSGRDGMHPSIHCRKHSCLLKALQVGQFAGLVK